MEILVAILGAAVVALAGLLIITIQRKNSAGLDDRDKLELRNMHQSMLRESREDLQKEMVNHVQLGSMDLIEKKKLIDQSLQSISISMREELVKLSVVVRELEKERREKFGEISQQIRSMGEQTSALTMSTTTLREALSSGRARGQWGERMAEDILRLVGFKEGINYLKQQTMGGDRSRPDFTFFLPNGEKLNMDVKFPLDNYVRYLESKDDAHLVAFRRDVRDKVKEVSSKGYIDISEGTLEFVLLFIPNESVHSFIHENDPDMLDEGLRNKVIWCSPSTLYCVLAVVRQAIDNFAMERTSDEMISLMGAFNEQWVKYQESVRILEKRLNSTMSAFHRLSFTRTNALERQLQKIEELRQARGLYVPLPGYPGGDEE